MKRIVKRLLPVAGVVFAFAGGVRGENFTFVGARATGMGGANAVSTHDATAQWHNPAAFGFFGRSEWATNAVDNGNLSEQGFSYEVLGAGLGYTMTDDLPRYLDILAAINFEALRDGNFAGDGSNVRSLLTLSGIIGKLTSGDAFYADATAGTSIQIGRFGIGVRMFGEAVGYAVPDRENLSLSSYIDGPALAADIRDVAALDTGFDSATHTFSVLTGEHRSDLSSRLGVAIDDDSIKYIDLNLQRLADAGDLTGEEIATAIDTLSAFIPGGGSIETNQSVVVGRGFALVEIPVSYGWAPNKNLSFGATAKAMYGSVLGTEIWIFDENNDEVLNDLSDNVENTLTLGIDLGVLYRVPKWQFALVGHNLNRPSFDGFTQTVVINGVPQAMVIPSVKIDPQLTTGVAFMPNRRLTLEANLDLLKTGTLLGGYDLQYFSVGGDLDLGLLSLQAGAYRNLAESWQDWVATLGLGANLFGLHAELGGAVSLGNNVKYDGHEIPSEARLFLNISMAY